MRGWLLLRNLKLGAQGRAAILSATSDETSFRDVSEKLGSLRSDADLALYDRQGPQKRGNEDMGTQTTSTAAIMTVTT